MPKWDRTVEMLIGIALSAAVILAGVGGLKDAPSYDSKDWYVAAGMVFAFGVLVWFVFFVMHPATVRASARRHRVLTEARAAKRPHTLIIHKALYGSPGRHEIDVTKFVAEQVANEQLDLGVANSVLGGDPAEGFNKVLIVSYTVDGKPRKKVIPEGARARLP